MSVDLLINKIKALKNPSVAGLDPRLDFLPRHILKAGIDTHGKTVAAAAAAILEFNRGLIDALCDLVPAVKLQSACYELLGPEGVALMRDTVVYARERGMYVIIDAKRGDIGSTAEAYAEAYLGGFEIDGETLRPFDSDAMTVNPYLGFDGIKPFAQLCRQNGKMIFVLAKTSNPSSGELQDLVSGDFAIYRHMGGLIGKWGADIIGTHGYSSVGAVVGATYPQQMRELREALPHTFFLVPGYGAQGADISDLKLAFNPDGLGAIVNSSRAIMCAWQKNGGSGLDFADAARAEAIKMKTELLGVCGL